MVHQFTTILLDGLGGALTDQKEYLSISLRNVNQLKCMIDDLLEASRADAAKLTVRRSTISLCGVVAQALASHAIAAKQKTIALKNDSTREVPQVYADPARILQVLASLLDNAIKFPQPNTTVTVRAEIFEEDPAFSPRVCCRLRMRDRSGARRTCIRPFVPGQEFAHGEPQGLGPGTLYLQGTDRVARWRNLGEHQTRGRNNLSFHVAHFHHPSLNRARHPKGRAAGSLSGFAQVEVRAATQAQLERDQRRMLRQVYQVLERSMLPDLDVLLPVQSRAGVDCFHIVARTDQRGSEVMVARFREQLSRCRELTAAGLQCAVSSEILVLDDEEKSLPSSEWIARLADERGEGAGGWGRSGPAEARRKCRPLGCH